MTAPSFHEWFNSAANPLQRASHAAQYFTQDALKAAFEAGEARAHSLHEKRAPRYDGGENIFNG